MKKNIFLFLGLVLVGIACSTKKNTFIRRSYHNFTTYYNTLFNGKEALKNEVIKNNKNHNDNFHEGYIEVFPENSMETDSVISKPLMFLGGVEEDSPQDSSPFQKAERKALKAIEKHSMVFGGRERNKEIFNAYILLVQARIYQGKLFEATEAIEQLYSLMPDDKRLPLAKIYEGLVFSKMKDYFRAENIFSALDKDPNLNKEYRRLLNVYYADNLLYSNRKQEAVERLDIALNLYKSRNVKSRIAYLKGQILAELGRKEEARASFAQAYKYAGNFEFEVKSQIEIAKTFSDNNNYEETKKYLEKLSEKGIYASRKNEFYYALGLLAKQAGKDEESREFFEKSIKEEASDSHIRGLAYFEIGKAYFQKENYIKAGAYYDSALAAIEHRPTRSRIEELSANIKSFSKNYYLVKKNDSILALTKMSEPERTAFFQKYINDLKEKEEKEAKINQENQKKERNKSFNGNNDFPSAFAGSFSGSKPNKFYFGNQETIAKGSLEFRKIWGNRSLQDNWRISKKIVSLNDLENQALDRNNNADARRFEISYYTEKIPTDKDSILSLKKARDTASLGLGRMYDAYFQNTEQATKTLYDLVEQKPEKEVKLQALYLVFSLNHEKNAPQAERAKNMIVEEFPDTPHAAFVKNPRNTNYTQTEEEVKISYQKAYALYNEEKYEEAERIIKQAMEEHPNDALIPKYELLHAYITGKTAGKEGMTAELEQIAFIHPKKDEGKKAKEILAILKGDSKKEEKSADSEKNIEESNNEASSLKTEEPKETPENIPQQENKPEPPKEKQNKNLPERPVQSWEKGHFGT